MIDTDLRELEITDAFSSYAGDYPNSALALITGLFVGFLEYSIQKGGGDSSRKITIDGNGSRDITIHPRGKREDLGWQPIETAPKDGTFVLVAPGLYGGKSCSLARYDDDRYAKKPRPFWRRDDDMGRVSDSRSIPPTHWMPLPEAPE